MVLQAEPTEQLDMQGTVLLSHLLTIVAFKLDTSHSFIVASCVIESGLEVEAFRETRCGCSSLGGRVRVDRIGRDCELEISKILLMVDPPGGGGGRGDRIESSVGARRHRVESGVGARYRHSPLLVSVG